MKTPKIILVIVILNTLFAKAQNPQPEYTSYESVTGTDMVNLLTGDLSYTLPIIDVPSPSGIFSIPLSYHAGFSPDEEASWVGLGWSLSCGSINRDINNYPDDFNGQSIVNHIENAGGRDYAKSWILYTWFTYNNGKNTGGRVGLGNILAYSWGQDRKLTVMGVNQSFNTGKTTADVGDVIESVMQVGETLVDGGMASSATKAEKSLVSSYLAAKNAAEGILGTISAIGLGNKNIAQGLWQVQYSSQLNGPIGWLSGKGIYSSEVRYFINSNVNSIQYGTLYLQNLPLLDPDYYYYPEYSNFKEYQGNTDKSIFDGTTEHANKPRMYNFHAPDYPNGLEGHDCHIYCDEGAGTNYAWCMNPTSLSYDSYSVMGEGVSGNITPYRLDVGSLANSDYGYHYNYRFNPSSFVNYKLPFKYKGEAGNHYLYHIGGDQTYPITDFESQFGASLQMNGNDLTVRFMDENFYTDSKKIESERIGFNKYTTASGVNYKFSSGNYIEWYTNNEIKNGEAFVNKNFLDFLPAENREEFRNNCINHLQNGNIVDYCGRDGIGGFSITRPDGYTLHFALPVYNLSVISNTSITNTDLPATTSQSTNSHKFAIHWLLTAITGPDYIDKNANNIVDDEDWGHWIKFEYTKHDNYWKRSPIEGLFWSIDRKSSSYTTFLRESYYLKAIISKTHVAYFVKSPRNDGYSNYPTYSPSLKLDYVCIFKKDDYNNLVNTYGSNLELFEKTDNNISIANSIKQLQLKKILFNYDYTLCPGFAYNKDGAGKLTLKNVSILYKNDARVSPGYSFGYSVNNPSFNSQNWDAWGMYKYCYSNWDKSATNASDTWCLKSITNPIGTTMEISYDRDKYSNVSGYDLGSEKYGGDNRVSQLKISDLMLNQYVNKYIYTQDGTETGTSSGVCSLEPEAVRSDIGLYGISKKTSLYDYPMTPVVYSKVTVRSGSVDSNTKEVYEFITPHYSMVNCNTKQIMDQKWGDLFFVKAYNYTIDVNTDQIGSLRSISNYVNDAFKSRIDYTYQNSQNLTGGIYSEGTLLHEHVSAGKSLYDPSGTYLRLFRTTKLYYPNILKSIDFTSTEGKSKVENVDFDEITGTPLGKEITNIDGSKLKNTITPAYKVYPEMGYKADNPSNKNMLTQESSGRIDKYIDNQWKILSASIQIWNKSWLYRDYNTTTKSYNDNNQTDVWRKHKSFIWKGEIEKNGIYKNFVDYNWSFADDNNASNGWVKTNEITRYNHYSVPLEVKEVNDKYAATHLGYNNSYSIATGANVNYTSFAYSGFESEEILGTDVVDFGSEIMGDTYNETRRKSNGTITAHTGDYYLECINGGGVNFSRRTTGSDRIIKGRKYRVSVWMHENSVSSSRLNISLQNGNILSARYVGITNLQNKKFGKWILVNTDVNIESTTTNFSAYISNDGDGSTYIDDMRIQPIDANVSAYTYDDSGNVSAILNNDNFAVKYEYDAGGRPIASYKETPDGFKKVSEQKYRYARSKYFLDFEIPTNVFLGIEATYNANDAGSGATYKWDFGNGVIKYGKTVTHIYTDPYDTKYITIEVTDVDGIKGSLTKSVNVLQILVNYPNAGTFTRGTSVGIDWESTFPQGDYYLLDLYKSGTLIENMIRTKDVGSYEWTIPYVALGSGYKIRITHEKTGMYYESGSIRLN